MENENIGLLARLEERMISAQEVYKKAILENDTKKMAKALKIIEEIGNQIAACKGDYDRKQY